MIKQNRVGMVRCFTIMLLISIVFPNVLFSQPAAITNIQVSQRTDGSGLTDIYFTLAGTASAYYVSVEASFNGGSTFTPIPAVSVSGDTGPMTAGSGKHIIWNGLQSFPNTYSTQSKLKLIAATTPPLGLPCPGTPTVFYGGQTYNTVQIGTQCWMAQNLNIGTKINGSGNQTNNSTIEKYCYNDLESNCNIYGGLYQWAEMVQYLNGATNTSSWNPVPTGNVTGICPTGWHIPTDAEWTTLTTYVNSQSSYLCNSTSGYIAKAMAATTLWNSSSYTCAIGNNLSLNNATGFTAGPAGYRTNDGAFTSIGYFSSWWSSSEGSTSNAWSRDLAYNYSNVYRSYHGKNYGFSVRCLRD